MYAALPTDLQFLIAEYSSGIPWATAVPEFVESICAHVMARACGWSCRWNMRAVSENPANHPLGMLDSVWEMHPMFKFTKVLDYDTGEFVVEIKGQIFYENWEDSQVH